MPGISLRYNLNKKNLEVGLENRDELFLESMNSIIYNNFYQKEVLLTNPCHVICTRYPQYPVKIFENKEFWACLEGKIYGKSEIAQEREMTDLIKTVFSTQAISDKQKKYLPNGT